MNIYFYFGILLVDFSTIIRIDTRRALSLKFVLKGGLTNGSSKGFFKIRT